MYADRLGNPIRCGRIALFLTANWNLSLCLTLPFGEGGPLAVGEVIKISACGAPHPALRATFPRGEGQR